MSLKTESSVQKSIELRLNPGEIFVSFITDRKPNTDILLESYFNTVFPVASAHGAAPLGNLIVDFTSRGDFNATDFIGMSKWKNQEDAIAFGKVFPEERLNELRKPIWNDLKIVASPVLENISFEIREDKKYEYRLLWGSASEIDQMRNAIQVQSGNILLDLPVLHYSDLKGEIAPQAIAIVEWDNHRQAFDHTVQEEEYVKVEAFYAIYQPSIPKEREVHTNSLAIEVAAKVDDVWQVLKTGADVDKWFPYITSCELKEHNGDLKRRCTSVDGKTLEESIVKIDKTYKVFVYTVDRHNLEIPIQNIRGIMRVKKSDEKTVVDWTVHFELTEQIDKQMLAQIQEGMVESMRMGIRGIETYLEQNQSKL